MKVKMKPSFEGMMFAIARQDPTENGEIPLSDSDMNQLHGVNTVYKALSCVFKDRLAQPVLVGASIRIALLADASMAGYSMEQFLAQAELTAAQLQKNADRNRPLPHSRALKHVAFGKLLESVSTAYRKHGTKLTVCREEGLSECPILAPGAFVQPDRPDELKLTGSFEIIGVRRRWSGGALGLYVGDNGLLVELPGDDPNWGWDKVHDALEQPTYFVGSLVRETKSSPWRPDAGAKLERQTVMHGFSLAVAS
jgi:hypothetical protein